MTKVEALKELIRINEKEFYRKSDVIKCRKIAKALGMQDQEITVEVLDFEISIIQKWFEPKKEVLCTTSKSNESHVLPATT